MEYETQCFGARPVGVAVVAARIPSGMPSAEIGTVIFTGRGLLRVSSRLFLSGRCGLLRSAHSLAGVLCGRAAKLNCL